MDTSYVKELVKQFAKLEPHDSVGQQECWNKMIEILSSDIQESIKFFQNECSVEELYWLSPVFEDVADKTNSQQLIKVWKNNLKRITSKDFGNAKRNANNALQNISYKDYIDSIRQDIKYAEEAIN